MSKQRSRHDTWHRINHSRAMLGSGMAVPLPTHTHVHMGFVLHTYTRPAAHREGTR